MRKIIFINFILLAFLSSCVETGYVDCEGIEFSEDATEATEIATGNPVSGTVTRIVKFDKDYVSL